MPIALQMAHKSPSNDMCSLSTEEVLLHTSGLVYIRPEQ